MAGILLCSKNFDKAVNGSIKGIWGKWIRINLVHFA